MRGFHTDDDLERRLRRQRPRPRDAFVEALSVQIRESRAARRAQPLRVALAAALTLGMLAALGAVGGLGYAANAAKSAASAVFSAKRPDAGTGWEKVTSGGDQYRPGYGFGDKNHNHTGPPGLQRKGSLTPVLHAHKRRGGDETVTTSFNIDEQADLTFSVVSPSGHTVQESQKRSKIGQGVSGPNTRAIHYRELVPRTIPVTLDIPRGQLVRGVIYRIKILARDPDGNTSTLFIRFRP
jgi:hypothetical protein